jgi:hypothetical protein
MNDAEKIDRLRKLLGAVVGNTKKSMTGKNANTSSEQKATAIVLKALLGREPTQAELALALTY